MSTPTTGPRLRRLASVIGCFAIAISVAVAISPTTSATAATASDFQDGYIISNANFTASGSMNANDVQAFLNAQVVNCRGGNGMPCLKDYSQSTPAIAADAFCRSLPGGTMSAAQIIVAAAQACGISPKVLVVMLQKEQGLITDTAPDSDQYRAALGQGCPDDAGCDPAYAGFFYQMYGGAKQLQKYLMRPEWWGYQLGWNNILYNLADTGCGTKSVNIRNDATRALYIYTPYTPNAAALNNLYGTGDRCSSYGNRNFWRLYTDWFGNPTGYPVYGDILARWNSLGAETGILGGTIEAESCSPLNGSMYCSQRFARGTIVWTPQAGAQAVIMSLDNRWRQAGGITGLLGYPRAAETCDPDGNCIQQFNGGHVVYSPGLGDHVVLMSLDSQWSAEGLASGMLGYPISDESCVWNGNVGCVQSFQRGQISWSPVTGAFSTILSMNDEWMTQQGRTGMLGSPSTNETCVWIGNAGCYQHFQGGSVTWTGANGGISIFLSLNEVWHERDGAGGLLGYPTDEEGCVWDTDNPGCLQPFQGGSITYSPSAGAHSVIRSLNDEWRAHGDRNGILGYPAEEEEHVVGKGNHFTQAFQNGTVVYDVATGKAHSVIMSFNAEWQSLGGLEGALGAPTANEACTGSGSTFECTQRFDGGTVYWSQSTGAVLR